LQTALAQGETGGSRPNIVIIVCDDAGYADFSVQGSKQVRTPRIDSIAENGVRFTNGYVSGCVCSPSRAGLLTGRYQQRFGHETNIPPRMSQTNGLPVEERTIADRLRAAGYRTIGLGKWHLGYADHFHPMSRGFDHYFGFLQGARSYWPLENPTRLNRLLRDREVVPESFGYLTDELGQQAASYIRDRRGEPFFLYLAFNAVHTPMHATEADLDGIEADRARRRKLVAMTHALDRATGLVLDALAAQAVLDDTLLFFINDNGGATNNASRNGPLRGRKGQVFEGGIRVPFLVQWPARFEDCRVVEEPVIALDIMPTCLEAAGVSLAPDDPLDGVSLVSRLTGDSQQLAERELYWRQGEKWAVRRGAWKLLRAGKGRAEMLFDLVADQGEKRDRIDVEPELAAELRELYDAWAAQLAEPRW